MNNINIRSYIINNLKDDNENKIKDLIETTISSQEEDALIGLGVLFELLWLNLESKDKDKYINIITQNIKSYNKD